MKKIEQIVREEQNLIGAQEMLMPTIQSSEIWKESEDTMIMEKKCSELKIVKVERCCMDQLMKNLLQMFLDLV